MKLTDDLRARYQALPPRDRRAVIAIAALLIPALLYLLLVLPLQRAHGRAATALADAEQDMQTVQDLLPQVQARRQGGGRLSQPLAQTLTDTAAAAGLTISRLQPKTDHETQLWLDDVSVDDTLRWLHQLESQYGVEAESVNLVPSRQSGRARVTLKLRAAG